MLHLQESSHGPKVIPQVEVPGGSNTTYYSFHYLVCIILQSRAKVAKLGALYNVSFSAF